LKRLSFRHPSPPILRPLRQLLYLGTSRLRSSLSRLRRRFSLRQGSMLISLGRPSPPPHRQRFLRWKMCRPRLLFPRLRKIPVSMAVRAPPNHHSNARAPHLQHPTLPPRRFVLSPLSRRAGLLLQHPHRSNLSPKRLLLPHATPFRSSKI